MYKVHYCLSLRKILTQRPLFGSNRTSLRRTLRLTKSPVDLTYDCSLFEVIESNTLLGIQVSIYDLAMNPKVSFPPSEGLSTYIWTVRTKSSLYDIEMYSEVSASQGLSNDCMIMTVSRFYFGNFYVLPLVTSFKKLAIIVLKNPPEPKM
jgi:hypothetical protein